MIVYKVETSKAYNPKMQRTLNTIMRTLMRLENDEKVIEYKVDSIQS